LPNGFGLTIVHGDRASLAPLDCGPRNGKGTMSQAIVDPAELRRFAHNLKRFNSELHGQMLGLHAQLLSLGESWRDVEQQKFVEEFTATLRSIGKFVEAANEHVPFLLRKADRAEEYLRQR